MIFPPLDAAPKTASPLRPDDARPQTRARMCLGKDNVKRYLFVLSRSELSDDILPLEIIFLPKETTACDGLMMLPLCLAGACVLAGTAGLTALLALVSLSLKRVCKDADSFIL